MRILIVEDNVTYGELLQARFDRSGLASDRVTSGAAAHDALAIVDYAAVILDLGLGDEDGMDFLRKVRRNGMSLPIIVTTARNALNDRIEGLRAGADDYIVKPFSFDELIARVHAVLRRSAPLTSRTLHAGNVLLDTDSRLLKVDDSVQCAGGREVDVLEVLISAHGSIVERDTLATRLFGEQRSQDVAVLDVYLYRLRKLLAEAHATVQIHTIRGVGYLLRDGGEAPR